MKLIDCCNRIPNQLQQYLASLGRKNFSYTKNHKLLKKSMKYCENLNCNVITFFHKILLKFLRYFLEFDKFRYTFGLWNMSTHLLQSGQKLAKMSSISQKTF